MAVGDRQPSWIDEAFAVYTSRYPRQWKFRIDQIGAVRRSRKGRSADAIAIESEQILDNLGKDEQLVLLDQKGKQLTSRALAVRLSGWQADGRDVCFVIGGPDGVSGACHDRADFVWSLSQLTLPHGLARVLVAEQLYRAWTLACGHPYHRD